MKEQYYIFAELRRIDEKALRLQFEIEKIPVETKKIDNTIRSHKDLFLKVKASVDEIEKSVRKLEQDLREKEDFLKKAESKMMEVKNNEEYRAALKENETHKKEKTTIEEKVLVLMNSLESEKVKLSSAEADFKTTESKLLQERAEYETERTKLIKYFEEQIGKRKSFTTRLTVENLAHYERARIRNKGSAVEIVDNEQCQGCNMRVRPQLYNEVLGMRVIHKCQSCGRILIPQQADAEVATS